MRVLLGQALVFLLVLPRKLSPIPAYRWREYRMAG